MVPFLDITDHFSKKGQTMIHSSVAAVISIPPGFYS